MKARFFFAVILYWSLATMGCSKEAENENWLPHNLQVMVNNSSNCVCDPYINQYLWRGQHIYMSGYSGPACNWIPTYYNIKGELVQMEQAYTLDNFLAESELVKNVWKCGR